jgi:hypothetical protein
MLYSKIDADSYKKQFKKKFENFCVKAPCLLSFVISDTGVQVIHENSETVYMFEWDFCAPIKSFIYEIKQTLLEKHYPRIIQVIEHNELMTPEEQANLIASGTAVDAVPLFKSWIEKKEYIITHVIVPRDTFILEDSKTGEKFRYHLKMSSVFFLKNYRLGKFDSMEDAGDWFFKKAELLNKIDEV